MSVRSTGVARLLRRWRDSPEALACILGLAASIPLFVWWLGWFPGFLSSDSIDQLGQAERFRFNNFHPAFHTLYLWMIMLIWESPGAITLLQAAGMAAMLALSARRLVQLGVPLPLAVGTVWVLAASPAVATTTISVWKDVPYTLALLWVFSELLLMARDPQRFWNSRWGPLRIGLGLVLVWLFRHNGFVTVVIVGVALGIGYRAHWRRVAVAGAVVGGSVLGVVGGLYSALSVDRASIAPAEVYAADVAAALKNEPDNFSDSELQYLATIAPLDVWVDRYDCTESTPLVFDPEFKGGVIRKDQLPFATLVIRTMLRDPDSVLGHRICMSSYLFWPPQNPDAYFHRPPFDIPANDLGVIRDPISYRAYAATKWVYVWAEPSERLWLTWRPALVVWGAAFTCLGLLWRRRLRRLMWAAVPLGAQLVNVAATAPAQEFRSAFGIYVMAVLLMTLLWLVARPDRARLAPASSHSG